MYHKAQELNQPADSQLSRDLYYSQQRSILLDGKLKPGAGEVAQQLKALNVLTEDLSSIPSPRMAVHTTSITTVPGDLMSASGFYQAPGTHVVEKHTCMPNTQMHTIKIDTI